jgi:hypothetical protein
MDLSDVHPPLMMLTDTAGGDAWCMRRASIYAVVAATVAATVLTGCSSAKPAMCDSLDAVRHSAGELKNANITENGLSTVKSGLTQLKGDLAQFATDAKAQFQPQVDALRSSVDQLQSRVTEAKAAPTAASLGAIRPAVSAVGDAARELRSAVGGTC